MLAFLRKSTVISRTRMQNAYFEKLNSESEGAFVEEANYVTRGKR